MISNAQIVPLLSKPLTRLLLLLEQTLSRSFSNRENHVRWFPSLYQSLRREWSIIDMQTTWYCPIVNITTSATRTCSFQPPVHAFRELMNKNASPPERTGKNLINVYWLTCSCAKRLIWRCTTLGITLLFFSYICYSCQKLRLHIF